jgi:hypothetical protein
LSYSREILAVIGDVVGEPTLQVVGTIGGENFASGEIVSDVLLHGVYLPFYVFMEAMARN